MVWGGQIHLPVVALQFPWVWAHSHSDGEERKITASERERNIQRERARERKIQRERVRERKTQRE
jgi:hypothetical protein